MEYITNLMTQVDTSKGPIAQAGWYFYPVDLNSSVGGDYIYTGYQLGSSGTPVTSLNYIAYPNQQNNPPQGWIGDGVDLNSGAGGEYIYMYWKTGEPKPPITNLLYLVGNFSTPPPINGYIQVGCDLNAGAGGSYIWGYYSTTVAAQPQSTKIKNNTIK